MPKIKVKNIPKPTQKRFCKMQMLRHLCTGCPFHLKERFVVDEYTGTECMLSSDYDPKETIIEHKKKDFPTNREWLESLSDEDLAAFYTLGIPLKDSSYINLYRVAMSFTSSQQGIKEWLSQPCKYLMEEE